MTDALDQAAELHLRGLREIRAQLALKTAEHAALDVAYSTALRQIEMLEKQLDRMTRERDHYQRYSHRVHTQMNEMGHQAIAVMRRLSDIQTETPYLPHTPEVHPEPEQPAITDETTSPDAADPPAFLRKGPRSEAELNGPLRGSNER